MILGIIPARGGSKGLPKKNIKPLLGKPMIGYTIEAAQQSSKIDRLVVSTEDPEIADVSKKFGVEVIKRPFKFATDEANIDGALNHAIEYIEKKDKKIEIVVWMQPNVPVRCKGDIDKVVSKLISSNADSVISMSHVDWPIEKACRIDKGRLHPYCNQRAKLPRRQDYTDAYISNGAVYAMRRQLFHNQDSDDSFDYFFGKIRLPYIMTKFEHGIEIHDEEGFLLAEMYLKNRMQNSGPIRIARDRRRY